MAKDKRKTKKKFAHLIGKKVIIPGSEWGKPDKKFRGRVTRRDPARPQCVIVTLQDGTRCFWPAEIVTPWVVSDEKEATAVVATYTNEAGAAASAETEESVPDWTESGHAEQQPAQERVVELVPGIKPSLQPLTRKRKQKPALLVTAAASRAEPNAAKKTKVPAVLPATTQPSAAATPKVSALPGVLDAMAEPAKLLPTAAASNLQRAKLSLSSSQGDRAATATAAPPAVTGTQAQPLRKPSAFSKDVLLSVSATNMAAVTTAVPPTQGSLQPLLLSAVALNDLASHTMDHLHTQPAALAAEPQLKQQPDFLNLACLEDTTARAADSSKTTLPSAHPTRPGRPVEHPLPAAIEAGGVVAGAGYLVPLPANGLPSQLFKVSSATPATMAMFTAAAAAPQTQPTEEQSIAEILVSMAKHDDGSLIASRAAAGLTQVTPDTNSLPTAPTLRPTSAVKPLLSRPQRPVPRSTLSHPQMIALPSSRGIAPGNQAPSSHHSTAKQGSEVTVSVARKDAAEPCISSGSTGHIAQQLNATRPAIPLKVFASSDKQPVLAAGTRELVQLPAAPGRLAAHNAILNLPLPAAVAPSPSFPLPRFGMTLMNTNVLPGKPKLQSQQLHRPSSVPAKRERRDWVHPVPEHYPRKKRKQLTTPRMVTGAELAALGLGSPDSGPKRRAPALTGPALALAYPAVSMKKTVSDAGASACSPPATDVPQLVRVAAQHPVAVATHDAVAPKYCNSDIRPVSQTAEPFGNKIDKLQLRPAQPSSRLTITGAATPEGAALPPKVPAKPPAMGPSNQHKPMQPPQLSQLPPRHSSDSGATLDLGHVTKAPTYKLSAPANTGLGMPKDAARIPAQMLPPPVPASNVYVLANTLPMAGAQAVQTMGSLGFASLANQGSILVAADTILGRGQTPVFTVSPHLQGMGLVHLPHMQQVPLVLHHANTAARPLVLNAPPAAAGGMQFVQMPGLPNRVPSAQPNQFVVGAGRGQLVQLPNGQIAELIIG